MQPVALSAFAARNTNRPCRPVPPAKVLGMDPTLQLLDPSGRPVSVLEDPTPIEELV